MATFLKKAHNFLDMSTVLPNKNSYAFCFCKQPDLLSQWRGYSAGGGYAIGFDIDPLGRTLIRKHFSLFPVEYGPEYGLGLQLLQADLQQLCVGIGSMYRRIANRWGSVVSRSCRVA